MKFILIILFPFLLVAQTHIVTASAFAVTSGLSEGYRLEWEQNRNLDYNKTWHGWKFASHISGIGLGIHISVETKFDLLEIGKALLLDAAVFWLLHDITINLVRKLPIDYVGTVAWTEASLQVKTLFLLFAIGVNIVI